MEDLVLGVRCISTVEEVCDRGWHDLLNLGGDENTYDAHQSELSQGDSTSREEVVYDVDGEEEGFRQ